MKNLILFFLLLIYNLTYSQYNNSKHLLLYGNIIKTTETSITLGNIKILDGLYDKEEITINLTVGAGIGYRVATLTEPTFDWIGKYVLIETVYVERFKGYYTTGKYGSWGGSQPALTPDGHTLYFLTQENNIKNGITTSNTKIIEAIQKAIKVKSIKNGYEKLKQIDKIIRDTSEFMFIREYYIWEINKINFNNTCLFFKQREIISSYIGNNKLPLYIRLKARDFYPNYSSYAKYYYLLYELKNNVANNTDNLIYKNLYNYRQNLNDFIEVYKIEVTNKIKEDEIIIKQINQKLNK